MNKILVLGDSHSEVWSFIKKRNLCSDVTFNIKTVAGATAYGCGNPNSKTESYKIFKETIKQNTDSDYVMIMLGEVDCGFLIWYKSQTLNIDVPTILKQTIDKYQEFIQDVVQEYFLPEQIILLDSSLPVIKDQTDKKFLTGARSQVSASISDRIDLTLEFNLVLNDLALKFGYNRLGITEHILDKDLKQVHSKFLKDDPYDHHVSSKAVAKIWSSELEKFLYNKKEN